MKRLILLLPLILAHSHIRAQDAAPSKEIALDAAYKLAVEKNPSFQSANARVDQAKAAFRRARSIWQPRVDFVGSGTWIGNSDSARDRNPLLDSTSEQYVNTLRASYLLFDGGVRKFSVQSAEIAAQSAEAQRDFAQLQLLSAVGRAFYSAQLARQSQRIAEADAEFNKRQLEDARALLQAGQGSLSDSLNFEIRLNAAANGVVVAKAQYVAALAGLSALLGRDGNEQQLVPVSFAVPEDSPSVPKYEQAWTKARATLPNIETLVLLTEQAEAQTRAAKGEWYPTLDVFGDVNATSDENPSLASEDIGTTVGLSLNWEIWGGGRQSAQVDEAEAFEREAGYNLDQEILDSQAGIRQAIATLSASVESLEIQKKTAALSKQNRDLVQEAYRAGQQSLLRLNEAQRDLITAESQLALAVIEMLNADLNLRLATGELLEKAK